MRFAPKIHSHKNIKIRPWISTVFKRLKHWELMAVSVQGLGKNCYSEMVKSVLTYNSREGRKTNWKRTTSLRREGAGNKMVRLSRPQRGPSKITLKRHHVQLLSNLHTAWGKPISYALQFCAYHKLWQLAWRNVQIDKIDLPQRGPIIRQIYPFMAPYQQVYLQKNTFTYNNFWPTRHCYRNRN